MPQAVNTECLVYTEEAEEVEPVRSPQLPSGMQAVLFGIGVSASHSTDSYLCARHACSMNASRSN